MDSTTQMLMIGGAAILALVSLLALLNALRSAGGGTNPQVWPPQFFHPEPGDKDFLNRKPLPGHMAATMISGTKLTDEMPTGPQRLPVPPTVPAPTKEDDLDDRPTNRNVPVQKRDSSTNPRVTPAGSDGNVDDGPPTNRNVPIKKRPDDSTNRNPQNKA
jgi:hypothetical protein